MKGITLTFLSTLGLLLFLSCQPVIEPTPLPIVLSECVGDVKIELFNGNDWAMQRDFKAWYATGFYRLCSYQANKGSTIVTYQDVG